MKNTWIIWPTTKTFRTLKISEFFPQKGKNKTSRVIGLEFKILVCIFIRVRFIVSIDSFQKSMQMSKCTQWTKLFSRKDCKKKPLGFENDGHLRSKTILSGGISRGGGANVATETTSTHIGESLDGRFMLPNKIGGNDDSCFEEN